MKYNITVWTINNNKMPEKLHYTFNQSELDELEEEIVKTNYDGSFVMTNGDIVEVEELV